MSETETLVQKHMRLLGISEEEAKALIEADKAIDKGEKMDFDLSKEQQKIAKKMTSTGTRTKSSNSPRAHKENPTKALIIDQLWQKLAEIEHISNLKIENKEKLITFSLNGNDYNLDLVQKRAKKA